MVNGQLKESFLNGNTKMVIRVTEVGVILGAFWLLIRMSFMLGSAMQDFKQGTIKQEDAIKALTNTVERHCRTDWTLQHEVLMTARLRSENPTLDSKIVWPDPCRVHDEVRRAND